MKPSAYSISQTNPSAVSAEEINWNEIQYHEANIRAVRSKNMDEFVQFLFEQSHTRGVVELATLERLAAKSKNKLQLGLHYLAYKGFLQDSQLENAGTFRRKFDQVVEDTLRFLDRKSLRLRKDNLTFPFDSAFELDEVRHTDTAISVNWNALSSGMRALIEQFARIRAAVIRLDRNDLKEILLLIDEGDAFLHLEWQRKYVELLDQYLGSLKSELGLASLQVILTTHSPVIATDFPSYMVTNLDGLTPVKTFAAPLDDIALSSFGANAIGSFAANKLNDVHARLLSGTQTDRDDALIEEIGDVLIRNAMIRARKVRPQ